MKLSYVIVTRNRRESLLRTLDRLEAVTALPRHQWEVLVVDNASDDDTVVRRGRTTTARCGSSGWKRTRACPLATTRSPCAAGKYRRFLDDDSYPTGDAPSPRPCDTWRRT